MIFYDIKNEQKTEIMLYKATWKYDYEYMLYFFQELIDRDLKEVEDAKIGDFPCLIEIKEEIEENNYRLRNCEQLKKEHSVMTIAGFSNIMNANIRITLFNQTNNVKLEVVDEKKEFDDRAFDNYMNSLEIFGYMDVAANQALNK